MGETVVLDARELRRLIADVLRAEFEREHAARKWDGQAGVLMSKGQVADLLGVTPRTVDRMRAMGTIPSPVDIPGRPRWARARIEAFVRERDAEAQGEPTE